MMRAKETHFRSLFVTYARLFMMRAAPTVPSGDTPCVTAGDARRANPWRSGEVEKWRSGEGEKRETSQPASTVPSGDTPCVTAGDTRRVNPWRCGKAHLRHRRCRTASTFTHTSLYSLNAFSATPPASEVDGVLPIHGFTLTTARASPAVKHGAPPLEA